MSAPAPSPLSAPAPAPTPDYYDGWYNGDGPFIGSETEGGISTVIIVILVIRSILAIGFIFAIACYVYYKARIARQYPKDEMRQEERVYENMERFLENIAKEKSQRYTSEQISNYTQNYNQKLGSGGFGVVYKGLLPEDVQVAVKVLNNNITKQVEEQFMAEVNSIGRTYHLNLVKLYGYCFEPDLKALIYEFMPNGSLDMILFGEFQLAINWVKRHSIAVGIAKGIAYLHEDCYHKIIHHDIKPANVLLDSRMNPKVGDFGLARLCNRDSTHVVMSGFKGTPGYAAPEVWTSYVTHKCDVYSFGMMLFEIVGRRSNHVRELSGTSKEWLPKWTYQKIRDGDLTEIITEFGVERDQQAAERTLKVALWCVQYAPGARPEMSVVVKMLEGEMEVPPPPNPFIYLEQIYEFDVNASDTINSSDRLNRS